MLRADTFSMPGVRHAAPFSPDSGRIPLNVGPSGSYRRAEHGCVGPGIGTAAAPPPLAAAPHASFRMHGCAPDLNK